MTAPQNPRVEITREEAFEFLERAMRNWRTVRFNSEELEDFRVELERFREAAEAEAKAREAALVEALGAIVPFAEDMTESGRQAIANAHRILAALTKEPDT